MFWSLECERLTGRGPLHHLGWIIFCSLLLLHTFTTRVVVKESFRCFKKVTEHPAVTGINVKDTGRLSLNSTYPEEKVEGDEQILQADGATRLPLVFVGPHSAEEKAEVYNRVTTKAKTRRSHIILI